MRSAKLQQEVEKQILASYEHLYRLAYLYVKNPDDAMDVVQESVYKAMTHSEDVRNLDSIKGWLCRIVIHTALDQLRRCSREVPMDEIPESSREDTYENTDVLRSLDVLEPRERNIVVLRYFEDLRLQDIAEMTGENLNTVKTILYRSLKKLKNALTEGEFSHGDQ